MPAAAKSDLVFTKTTSDVGGQILVPIAFDSVSVQTVVNAIREYEEVVANMDTSVGVTGTTGLTRAIGKVEFPSAPGKFTGITCTLINDWRVAFEARAGPSTVEVFVFGGTLFGNNSFLDNPIEPTAFTQVQIQQTEAPPFLDTNLASDIWDALRSAHTIVGSFGEGVNIRDSGIGSLTFAPGAITVLTFATSALEAIADELLDRDVGAGADTGTDIQRTLRQAIRVLRNRVRLTGGGALEVYKEDDATIDWSGAFSTAPGNPVTEVNPAGGS